MSFITNSTDCLVLPEDSHLWEKYQPSSSSASFHSLALEILWCPTAGSNKKQKQVVYLRHANYATYIKTVLEQAVVWEKNRRSRHHYELITKIPLNFQLSDNLVAFLNVLCCYLIPTCDNLSCFCWSILMSWTLAFFSRWSIVLLAPLRPIRWLEPLTSGGSLFSSDTVLVSSEPNRIRKATLVNVLTTECFIIVYWKHYGPHLLNTD